MNAPTPTPDAAAVLERSLTEYVPVDELLPAVRAAIAALRADCTVCHEPKNDHEPECSTLRAAPPAGPAVDAVAVVEVRAGRPMSVAYYAQLPDGLVSLYAAPITCRHEAYLGACIHCGAGIRDGRAYHQAPPEAALAGHAPQGETVAWAVVAPSGTVIDVDTDRAVASDVADDYEYAIRPLTFAATPQEPR